MTGDSRLDMDSLGAIVRTDNSDDYSVVYAAIFGLVVAAQLVGGMTPREIGQAAAAALVEKGGFHRRQYC